MHSEARDRALLSEPEFKNGNTGSWSEAELRGETAVIYGDDQTAVKLFERSVAEHPTLLNEFNLAACYSRTGRPLEAMALYRKIADSGSGDGANTISPLSRAGGETSFKIAEEARRRQIELILTSDPLTPDAPSMTADQAARADAVTPTQLARADRPD